jgi:NAD(P)-dependent dehydrogenase (short-subunit alcohol dehydrogenase family)
MRKQRILITGASSGFGRGAALGLAKRHDVYAACETWQQVNTLRQDAGEAKAKLTVIKLDLLSEIDLAHAATLEVDTLVLNAGVQENGSLVDIPMELVRRSFDINVFAHLDLAQRLIPGMIKRKSGKVVWVSSLEGLWAPPFMGAYAATKHAIEALASSMKAELNPLGIGVMTVNPGLYRTGYNETGAETPGQWEPLKEKVHLPFPDAAAAALLKAEHDPQSMIDAMVKEIPNPRSIYRLMVPKDAEVEAKAVQALQWKQKAR